MLIFVLLFGLGVSALGLLLFGFCVWGYVRGGLGFFDLLFDLVCFLDFVDFRCTVVLFSGLLLRLVVGCYVWCGFSWV